jgi:hypothetical protein
LRELAGERNRGQDLVQIEVAPGVELNANSLFDARAAVVREADLENGRTAALHRMFYDSIGRRESQASPATSTH